MINHSARQSKQRVQNDIELIEEMIDESAILEAMDHCKDAIDRLQYLYKLFKRIK